jgi:hypothetical protein
MTILLLTQASASETAAKPPSTTRTNRRPGSHRRTCCIICRTHSTLLFCRRRPPLSAGQHSAVRNGNTQIRRLQGTGPKSIMLTHLRPKPRMTCFLLERTASR